jgi:hypothetical protein
MTKQCSKCKIVKPTSDFNWRNKAKGWLRPECRTCQGHENNHYYYHGGGQRKHTEYHILNQERRIESAKKYVQENGHRRRKYDPEKSPARIAVYRAIKRGSLIRPNSCERCGVKGQPEAHHHKGYDKKNRLDVIWLCSRCHPLAENPEYAQLKEELACTLK